MIRFALLAAFALSTLGCGGSGSGATSARETPSVLATLPVTVEGTVSFDVIEGDEEFGDYGDWNFGSLMLDGKEVLVHADGPVLRNLKIPATGGKVRATLSSMKNESGVPMYTITSIEAL